MMCSVVIRLAHKFTTKKNRQIEAGLYAVPTNIISLLLEKKPYNLMR